MEITYNEWVDYIRIRKIRLLKQIDKTSILDTSNENILFNTNLKSIFSMDIFNLSRISYLAFSFLDIYINNHLQSILENDIKPNNTQNNTCTILECVINIIIHIEFILNLHFFIIIYIIRQHTIKNHQHTDISKPKILYKIEKICKDIETQIKPSTIILLLLKINHKLCNILGIIDNKLIQNEIGIIKQIKELNKKLSFLLDSFILAIAKNTNNNIDNIDNIDNTNTTIIDRYELSVNYICDLANILYMYFDIGFDILIKYIIKECNPVDTKHIEISKKSISGLLKSEINTLETKLFEY